MTQRRNLSSVSLTNLKPLPKPKLRIERDIFNSTTTIQVEDEYLDLQIELRFDQERGRRH